MRTSTATVVPIARLLDNGIARLRNRFATTLDLFAFLQCGQHRKVACGKRGPLEKDYLAHLENPRRGSGVRRHQDRATDPAKRELFDRLSLHLSSLLHQVEQAMLHQARDLTTPATTSAGAAATITSPWLATCGHSPRSKPLSLRQKIRLDTGTALASDGESGDPPAQKPDFRGRDASYLAPPAQIRASPIRAHGSHLGCLTAKRLSGHG